MPAKVEQLASFGIVGMMKFARETGERIRRISGCRFCALKVLSAQVGACMTVPHTLHVRCCKLE